jgi:peroxiredoxin Q/BCP
MSKWLAVAAVCASLTAVTAARQQAPVELKVKAGDKAPDFSLPGTDGKTHKLSDYKGREVVLAWFPAAFTGG